MKVIIAGSRTCTRIADVIDAIHKSGFDITEVISGTCYRGPDNIGEWLARVFFDEKIPVKRFPADWHNNGLAGGPIRNKQMAEYADALILVWDGESSGSRSMLNHAKANNLKIYQHIIK